MEAALSWLQFPQQDANNIEKKPKVHLEIEVQKGGRQDVRGWPWWPGTGPLLELETPNP